MKSKILFLIVTLCLSITSLPAQDDDAPKRAYLDAESAGVKFKLQGEYSGDIKVDGNNVSLGVQVFAAEKNKLKFKAYVGGLPGDGWSGNSDEIMPGEGEVSGSKAILTGENGSGEIVDGELTIFDPSKSPLGKLKKVERSSPTLGAKPPAGAVVLFDGTTADNFENGKLTEDKLLKEGVTSKQKFQDFELHLEFRLSFMPNASGQGRSNSGCYLQGRYEVQILDSFGLKGVDDECGGIYKVSKPELNMCFPPLSWQTYDIEFRAAKFDSDGKKTSNAKVTVKHNGVVIHRNREVPKPTPAAPITTESADPGPLFLQNHGDPLRFRNIWIKPL